jgi:hypothetical protein
MSGGMLKEKERRRMDAQIEDTGMVSFDVSSSAQICQSKEPQQGSTCRCTNLDWRGAYQSIARAYSAQRIRQGSLKGI